MIRFGRMALQETWAASDAELISASLNVLRQALSALSPRDELVSLDSNRRPHSVTTEQFLLTVYPLQSKELSLPVAWQDTRAGELKGRWIGIRVLTLNGTTLAGVLLRLGRVYAISDCCRALEASFDTGLERRGRYAVLDCKRVPLNSGKAVKGLHRSGLLAAFHCENPGCSHFRRQLLLPVPPGKRKLFIGNKAERQAHPCPFCRGSLEKRWALHFDGVLGASKSPEAQRARNAVFVDFPVESTYRRPGNRCGPMQRVTRDMEPHWGNCWDSTAVRQMTAALTEGLEGRRLPQLLRAACDSEANAQFVAAALDPVNIRAFVECARDLPMEKKTRALALAMAYLFMPRRRAKHLTSDDGLEDAAARHPYIALHPGLFFERLRFFGVLEHRGTLLDVGCGIGEKPFLAYALGRFTRCDGMEVNQQTIAVADYLLSSIQTEYKYPISIFEADALAYRDYDRYDVIYMYRPIRNARIYVQLMRYVTDHMKPGSLVFDVYFPLMAFRREEDGLYRLAPGCEDAPRWEGPIELEDVIYDCGLER